MLNLLQICLAVLSLANLAYSSDLPFANELKSQKEQGGHRRAKREVCVDIGAYCDAYKNHCKDPAYKDYLMKECPKTCDFCAKPCFDRFLKCSAFLSVCKSPYHYQTMKWGCDRTCGFCKVPTTTQAPTTLPRTEKPIVHTDVKCGTKAIGNTRIVGGIQAQKGAWPWQITMNYNKNGAAKTPHWCGGSVIDRQWIITAAHCFAFTKKPDDYTIVIGQHDLNSTDGFEQTIPIEKIIIHPLYDAFNHHDYDVALLKMKNNITYNDRVRPICLPKQDYPAGTNCYITGWGHLNESGHGPWVLHQAMVPLISRQSCQKSFDNLRYTISPRMRCAGNGKGDIDACQGDSGGPLTCKTANNTWELVGLVSWGVGCARKNRYGVYADMVDLKYWVQGQVHSN